MGELPYVYGIFRCEIKNRFRCLVNIAGEDTICYIQSSCKLGSFIDLKNKKVLLLPIKSKDSNIKYSVFAVKYGRSYVLLNLSMANRIIEKELRCKHFSFLGGRNVVSHESVIAGYKSDLYIRESNTVMEIKTILSTNSYAEFPTVHSERSIKQLLNIERLLENGYNVCYVFVALSPYVKTITLNSEKEFLATFNRCVKKGMSYCAVSVHMRKMEFKLYSNVDIVRLNESLPYTLLT